MNITVYFIILVALQLLLVASFYLVSRLQEDQVWIVFAVFSGLFALFCGFRPENVGSDTEMYMSIYGNAAFFSTDAGMPLGLQTSWLYHFLNRIFAVTHLPPGVFFSSVILYFNWMLWRLARLVLDSRQTYLLFVVYLSSFFYYDFSLNLMRNFLSLAFIIHAYFLLTKGRTLYAFILAVFACSVHSSSILYVVTFLAVKKIPRLESVAIWFWLSIAGLSFMGIDLFKMAVSYFTGLDMEYLDQKMLMYTTNEEYITGFRLNFFITSAFFPLMWWVNRHLLKKNDRLSFNILLVCVLISPVQFLFFSMPHNDRFGILAWIWLPYFIVYLLRKPVRNITFSTGIQSCLLIGWMALNSFFIFKHNFN